MRMQAVSHAPQYRSCKRGTVMGTKNHPSKFDCYASAEPDEPIFVLLGRDKHAPVLVDLWANLREGDGEDPAKVSEAIQCAKAMIEFRRKRKAARDVIKIGVEEMESGQSIRVSRQE
jgi:hypothetical protein